MKSAQELLKIARERKDWKSRNMFWWANGYGDKAQEWNDIYPPVTDERRLFIDIYKQVYDAISSLTDNPNNWVCCAVATELKTERERMDDILAKFGHIVGA